jgi:hypothetical protein
MLEAGLSADGFDIDPAMLEDLKRKLRAKGLKAGIHHADMRDFTLPRRYALIVIPFNSFGHNLTQEDQIATLRCCRDHLEEGGRLSLVMFHPKAAKLLQFDGTPMLVKEIPSAREPGTVRVWDEVASDRVAQINTVRRRAERLDPSGTIVETHLLEFQIRYIWKPEMELLFRVAGYRRWQARPLFESRDIEEGDMLEWSAWKE